MQVRQATYCSWLSVVFVVIWFLVIVVGPLVVCVCSGAPAIVIFLYFNIVSVSMAVPVALGPGSPPGE